MCLGAELHASSVMVALGATECGGPGKLWALRWYLVKCFLVFKGKKHVNFKKVQFLQFLCTVLFFDPSLNVLAIQATT